MGIATKWNRSCSPFLRSLRFSPSCKIFHGKKAFTYYIHRNRKNNSAGSCAEKVVISVRAYDLYIL